MVERGARPGEETTQHSSSMSAASDGERWLVAWGGAVDDDGRDTQVVLARLLSPDGLPCEQRPLLCMASGARAYSVSVAYGAGVYLLVWSAECGPDVLFGARVSVDGVLLDPEPLRWPMDESSTEEPDVGFDGENFVVTWMSSSHGTQYGIRAARVTPAGHMLDCPALRVPSDTRCNKFPAVAGGGGNSLIAWQAGRSGDWQTTIARLSSGGVVLDSCVVVHDGFHEVDFTGVAASDSCWLVAWSGEEFVPGQDSFGIGAVRVGFDGQVLDSIPIRVWASWGYGNLQTPAVVGMGYQFLVEWVDRYWRDDWSMAVCLRVNSDGSLPDTAPAVLGDEPGWYVQAGVAWNGREVLAAWLNPDHHDVVTRRVGEAGVPVDTGPVLVNRMPASQHAPSVSSDGETFLAVWTESESDDRIGTYASRFGPGGAMNPDVIVLSPEDQIQSRPVVAGSDAGYLVATEVHRGILCHRVGRDGVLLDSTPLLVSTLGANDVAPALASDGERWLLVWLTEETSGRHYVTGMLIEPDGTMPEDYLFYIDRPSVWPGNPSVAWHAGVYLVAWCDAESVVVARVTGDGELLDPTGQAIARAELQGSPVVGAGEPFLVAWARSESDRNGVIESRFVHADGTCLSPRDSVLGTWQIDCEWDEQVLAVAPTSTGWLLTWVDSTVVSGLTTVRLGFDGRVSQRSVVEHAGFGAQEVALAAGSQGQVACLWTQYTRFDEGSAYFGTRVWASFGPFPGSGLGLPDEAAPARRTQLVRGSYYLRGREPVSLHDAMGRRVFELAPGENVLTGIPPGVYFIRAGDSREPSRVLVLK